MIHYHGTPITPMTALYELRGRNFCVSHMAPRDVKRCHDIGQSVMLDNGAFSKWKSGKATDWPAFYAWCDRWLDYPTTWAIPPDVIDAPSQEQDGLLNEWPHGKRMKVLVCLSGGIDSALVLDMMLEHEVVAVGFNYGQPHAIELQCARRVAEVAGVKFHEMKLNLIPLVDEVVFAGRNMVLAAQAISIAAAVGCDAVAFGCNQSDWGRFPDCRPAFWKGINAAAGAYGVSVLLPLLHMTKAQVVTEAKARGLDIAGTWSCYSPQDGRPCGKCLACETRTAAGA